HIPSVFGPCVLYIHDLPSSPTRRSSDLQSERAAGARRADEPQFAAEHPRQLAADREPEPGAAVFPARASVRLLERFEDDLLLFRDRKSTRLNSSHQIISYAVFCLKKKTN